MSGDPPPAGSTGPGAFHLTVQRERRTPVRVAHWDVSIRAGDDFKLALTLLSDDAGTPASVSGSASALTLWPEAPAWGYYWSGPYTPEMTISGWVVAYQSGRLNFAIPAADTALLGCGRYGLAIAVDLPDGAWTVVEGVLQVRDRWDSGLGHVVNADTVAALTAGWVNGQPVDANGFFLLSNDFAENTPVWDGFVWDDGSLWA